MPIVTPGKRPCPRLQKSKVFGKKGGFGKKHGGYASLNLTPMVDMFTIIVIYLIQNFSSDGDILYMSKDIQLPNITAKFKLERAPVVSVSAESISLNGSRIVDVADLTRDDTWNVPALEEAMREERKKIEASSDAFHGDGFKGIVNMQSDKAVQFKILKKVMFACNQAGFGNVNFAGYTVTGAAEAVKTASNP